LHGIVQRVKDVDDSSNKCILYYRNLYCYELQKY
jgi:hypothetical protein